MDDRELILQYADSLKTDLTWASKTHINMLTMLAAENKSAAASICAAIERHILSVGPPSKIPVEEAVRPGETSHRSGVLLQAPAASKLPTLYLVDSIVKNVKEPYIGLFCRNLVQVRTDHTWKALPALMPHMLFSSCYRQGDTAVMAVMFA